MGSEQADELPHDEGDIFDGVVYYLSASLKSDIAEAIRVLMSANRGQEVMRRDAHQATHIISVSHGLEKTDLDVSIPSNPGQVTATVRCHSSCMTRRTDVSRTKRVLNGSKNDIFWRCGV